MTTGEHAPEKRFTDRADEYAAHRPSYPDEAVSAMLRGLGAPEMMTVVDVGAGTGISARLVADRGPLVVALEPNAAMREKAEPHERVIWEDGTAEVTGLKTGTVNLVLCAQAFHWFDRELALAEFRRILRPTGRLALVWNEIDTADPFSLGYRVIADESATDDTPRVRYAAQDDPFAGQGLFDGVRLESYPFEQPITAGGLVGRAASASYAPKSGPGRDAMESALRALHAEHAGADGVAVLRYQTAMWTASVKGDEPLVRVGD